MTARTSPTAPAGSLPASCSINERHYARLQMLLHVWTQSILLPARAIYRSRGFEIVKREP